MRPRVVPATTAAASGWRKRCSGAKKKPRRQRPPAKLIVAKPPPPDAAHLQALVRRIAERVGRMLERRGLIERDAESAWLSGEPGEAGALDDLIGHSITYRIAVGPRAGQKVFTLRSSPVNAPG